jgi:ammonium transporter, Amt family
MCTTVPVGLVAITPAAGFIAPLHAILLGAIAAVPSYVALQIRSRSRLDDSLDVFAAHGVGGIVGALLTGVFASRAWGAPSDGLLAGNPQLVVTQLIALLAAGAYSGVMTFLILRAVALVLPLRRPVGQERLGLDVVQHGEEAYSHGEGALLVLEERRIKPRSEEAAL